MLKLTNPIFKPKNRLNNKNYIFFFKNLQTFRQWLWLSLTFWWQFSVKPKGRGGSGSTMLIRIILCKKKIFFRKLLMKHEDKTRFEKPEPVLFLQKRIRNTGQNKCTCIRIWYTCVRGGCQELEEHRKTWQRAASPPAPLTSWSADPSDSWWGDWSIACSDLIGGCCHWETANLQDPHSCKIVVKGWSTLEPNPNYRF